MKIKTFDMFITDIAIVDRSRPNSKMYMGLYLKVVENLKGSTSNNDETFKCYISESGSPPHKIDQFEIVNLSFFCKSQKNVTFKRPKHKISCFCFWIMIIIMSGKRSNG